MNDFGASIKRIDHTAVVVADMDEAIPRWQLMTGATLGVREAVPSQRVEIAMLHAGDTAVELISPLDDESGVARFLAKRGECLHHIGMLVEDIQSAMRAVTATGMLFLDTEPRHGADGLVAFIDPRSTGGVLLELIQREADV